MNKSFLTDHPNFVSSKVGEYFYQENDVMYSIKINHEASELSIYPVTWKKKPYYGGGIWSMPEWFKNLYFYANKLHHQKTRIRIITENKRRDIYHLIFLSSIFEENGKELYEEIKHGFEYNNVKINKSYQQFIENLVENLKTERYEVSMEETNDNFIYLTIK